MKRKSMAWIYGSEAEEKNMFRVSKKVAASGDQWLPDLRASFSSGLVHCQRKLVVASVL